METIMEKRALHKAEERLYNAEARLKYDLARLGDKIAKKMEYRKVTGLDAITRYLVDKHHWLPSDVQHLTLEEIDLLIDGDFPDLWP
jgi:hypothetical protein